MFIYRESFEMWGDYFEYLRIVEICNNFGEVFKIISLLG